MLSSSAPTVHQYERCDECVWTSSMAWIASRMVREASSSPLSHASRPRWYRRRCLSRNDGSLCVVTVGRPRRQVRVEQVGGGGRLDAPGLLHQLIFRKQFERHRIGATDQFVEEYAQLAARPVDQIASGLHLRRRGFLEPKHLALEFVGVCRHRVEADHLDRACRLMDVRTRMFQRRRIVRRRLERRQRFEPARERLVDLTLDPGLGAEIEFRCGIVGQGRGHWKLGRGFIGVTPRKNRARGAPAIP